ncbi:MAG: amidohydrolase family protein [Gemmatimonadota bacterium]|nr:amidohydrolase family protein [Gemmatimonadota bacterium]
MKRRSRMGRGLRLTAVGTALVAGAVCAACTEGAPGGAGGSGGSGVGGAEMVIVGGRVMDPDTGRDEVTSLAIADGRIVAIGAGLAAPDTIDATGLVVAPGFIDLHAHGQDSVSARLQALDGVTTALEMEIGVYPVAEWIASREGSAIINFGATVSHPGARVKLLTGVDVGHSVLSPPDAPQPFASEAVYESISDEQIVELTGLIEQGLREGGLGIGFGITYTPGASRTEILRAFQLGSAMGAPAYVHLRGENSGGTLGAFQEAIANAAATGASVHIVHMNSSADEMARTTLEMIRGARERGLDVTTESYPYTASSTRIESALFDAWEGLGDEDYARLQWSGTPERLDTESFRRYREQGGWVVIHGRNEETNEWIVAQPDVIVASDGIPYLYESVHPRGAGTFARVLGYYVRERGALSLMDALSKMTIQPARRVEGFAPAMAAKGRVQVGADADLTLFDPETIIDRATYAEPAAPSEGVVHVLVGGVPVVREGGVVEGAYPGRAITSEVAAGS